MRNVFLRNVGLSALMCLCINVHTAQAAVKLGSYYGGWTATVTYAAGDVVTFSNKTYLSLIAANKNKNPATVITAWQVLGLGATGPQGPQGVAGPQGLKGDTGAVGSQGIQGNVGATGAKGIQGLQGLKGDTGSQGLQGLKGDQGPQGLIGLTGAKGNVGPQGIQGLTGLQGLKGDTGSQGLQGLKGDQGPQGLTGPAGGGFNYYMNCGVSGNAACKVGAIGPGGGWIFFVDKEDEYPGFTYLEAAPTDIASVVWCNKSSFSIYAIAPTPMQYWALKGVGQGRANTAAMVSICSSGAANDAANYSTPTRVGWFLPSLGELMLMYENLLKSGVGGFTNLNYWSSSEGSGSGAWNQGFGSGYQNNFTKGSALPVRAVRAF